MDCAGREVGRPRPGVRASRSTDFEGIAPPVQLEDGALGAHLRDEGRPVRIEHAQGRSGERPLELETRALRQADQRIAPFRRIPSVRRMEEQGGQRHRRPEQRAQQRESVGARGKRARACGFESIDLLRERRLLGFARKGVRLPDTKRADEPVDGGVERGVVRVRG